MDETPDAIIARTVEQTALLRSGGAEDADDEVLATYFSETGEKRFAICRHGLVLGGRYVANEEIEQVRLGHEVKAAVAARRLLLHLPDGEIFALPVEGARGRYLDIFPIYAFLRRRVHQARRGFGRHSQLTR